MSGNKPEILELPGSSLAIGPGRKTVIIAEIGQAHDGSLGIAHSYIDRAAEVGIDIIKFQTHIAMAESTLDEPFRVKFSREDDCRYDYWKRMEFTPEQWDGLLQHAREKGLLFLSSPFSVEAVELLDRLGVAAWKVGSGEVNNRQLLAAFSRSGKPVFLSSGMSGYEEIETAVRLIGEYGNPLALLQCTSMYPTPLEKVGLNVVEEFKKFGVPLGLSDHSGRIYPGLAALARGIDLLEVHVTFDRRMFGVDNPVSLNFEELEILCQARDAFHLMDQSPVNKDDMAAELQPMRACFNKSAAVKMDLRSGTILQRQMLTVKKPGTGIPGNELESLVGKKLARDVRADRLLSRDDLVDARENTC